MMKKCSVITGMILASLLLFMNSCEKDYLNAEEISYSLTVSDTVYLNEPNHQGSDQPGLRYQSLLGKLE